MTILGIDIAKHELAIYDLAAQKWTTCPYTETSIFEFLQTFPHPKTITVIIESTGVYHKMAHRLFDQAGCSVAIVNPLKSRHFAKSMNFFAKTDRVDAKMLAVYGEHLQHRNELRFTPYPPEHRAELDELLTLHDHLTEEKKRLTAALEQNPRTDFVQKMVQKQWAFVTEQLTLVQKRMNEVVEKDPQMTHARNCLTQVKGIGNQTAAMLLCRLPELGHINRKEIAALVGVAPKTCDSGTFKGRAIICGGRQRVRNALYMPLLTAVRLCPLLQKFYQRLKDSGKPSKVALIACMRKLITYLNSLLKNNPYKEEIMPI
jgi:transposase